MNFNILNYLERTKITAVLIGATALLAAVGCSDLENADPPVLNGILQNVDSISGEVTVELKDGTTATFNLDDVDVGQLQAIAGTALLEAGDEVTELTFDNDSSVTSVSPLIVKIEGTVLEIDSEALTISVVAENGIELTVNVDPQTRFSARGKGPSESSLDELTVDTEIDLEYNHKTMHATRIHFSRNNDSDDVDNEDDGESEHEDEEEHDESDDEDDHDADKD